MASPPVQDTDSYSNPRTSVDSTRGALDTSTPLPPNGNSHDLNAAPNGHHEEEDLDDVERLQQELERTRIEKDNLADQYRSLLAKLTAMRTTLGNKLKEDAEELDRREQLVQQLQSQNEQLQANADTLQNELLSASNESAKLTEELSLLRTRVVEESAHEASLRERQIHDLQAELELVRTEKDEWQNAAQQESVAADETRTLLAAVKRDLEVESAEKEAALHDLAMEREKSANLQSVLEDFQSAKEADMRNALADYDLQIRQTTQSLAEYKSRALSAEAELSELNSSAKRLSEVEAELKDKTALIGKLRHESVIANEHLTEALRRLRKNASSENVDRRLITNVLLSYLTTARGDSKRFEMLSLIASILSWSETEREQAGLQRTGTSGVSTLGRKAVGVRQAEKEAKVEESESFSKMWVEFLLKEAAQGVGETSSSSSPRSTSQNLPAAGLPSGLWSPGGMRSPSFSRGAPPPRSASVSVASAPGTPPPSKKEHF